MEKTPDWKKDLEKQSILDKLHLTVNEISELGIGWLITCFVLLYLYGILDDFLRTYTIPDRTIIFLLVIGISFFTHELMHKFTAQKFGAKAEFKIAREGLILMAFSLLIGFPLLTVGAVFWWGETSSSIGIRGRVSAAGPISNLILVGLFYILMGISVIIAPSIPQLSKMLFYGAYYGVSINIFIGLFNLLPLGILDGAKVLAWDIRIWVMLIAIFIAIGFAGGGFGYFL
jgi:Zn-dependent protease